MAGTGWQSSDLLTRFNALAARPATDAITDPQKYLRLADAQDSVLQQIASIAPKPLYGAPALMTTSDGGYTFTFGTDGNGYPLFPLGMAQIYPNLNAVPDFPWNPGVDYLDEGVQVRIPNNRQWTGSLYWRGITSPQQISASVQPVLQPPPARILIVIEAVRSFAEEGVRNGPLADQMNAKWEREFPKQMTAIRRHFRGRGYLSSLTTPLVRAAASF